MRLSLSLYHSISCGYLSAELMKHVDLAHISLRKRKPKAVYCQYVSPETIHLSKPNPTNPPTRNTPCLTFKSPSPSSHLNPQWVVDIQTCGSENEMLTHLLLFHRPLPLGLLMAPDSTWTKDFSGPVYTWHSHASWVIRSHVDIFKYVSSHLALECISTCVSSGNV